MAPTLAAQVTAEDTPGHTLYGFIAVKCPRTAKSIETESRLVMVRAGGRGVGWGG